MALHSRRRLLQAVTALTAGLAGCGGFSGSTSRSDAVADGERDPPDSNSETDPPQLVARAATERPPLRLADPDENGTDEGDPERRLGPRDDYAVIDSRETADRLTLADGVTVEGNDDLASFLEATAFDEETLYLQTNAVQGCFRLELCWVSWGPREIETDYARTLLPYDEACTVDAQFYESRLIRLPVALDADEVNSYGTSIGSGSCDRGGGE
jgi:hypothetical protein